MPRLSPAVLEFLASGPLAHLVTVGPEGEGSVVAIEPKTGRILAMVSLPSYDPNDLATHDFDASSEAYQRLDRDEQEPLAYGDDPRRNMAGVLERVGPFRWRLVIPWPLNGAKIEVFELTPVADQPE